MDAELRNYLDGMVGVLSARIYEVDVNAERRTEVLRQEMNAGFRRVDDRLLDVIDQLRGMNAGWLASDRRTLCWIPTPPVGDIHPDRG